MRDDGERKLGDPPSRDASADKRGRGSRRKAARPALGPDDRIHGGRNREAQMVRNPRRKLFNKERKKIFLEWFAGTANMSWAAEVAGVSYKTVSKHILKDPIFAGEVHEAMQLGVLRAKAKMLETSRQPTKIGIDGDLEVPELDMTREQAQQAVREHDRTLTLGRKPGRVPRIAGNAEVVAVVRKRLKVFAARVRARGRGGDIQTNPDLCAGGESTPTPTLPHQGGGGDA